MTRARSLSQLANSNVFSVDGGNNRIGIGSTTPDAKLDVQGNIEVAGIITAAAGAAVTYYGDGSGLTGVASTDNIITGTAATFNNQVTIQNLYVGAATTIQGTLSYEDVTNVDSLGIITARSHVSIADSILHTGDTDTAIRFPANNTFTVETAGSERLRIDSSGRVGIGTDDPDYPLEVNGGSIISTILVNSHHADGPLVRFDRSGSEIGFLGSGSNLHSLYPDPDGLSIRSQNNFVITSGGATPRIWVNASGLVGVGTTNPEELLHLYGADPSIRLQDSSGDAFSLIEGDNTDEGSLRFRADPLSAGANTHIRFDTDGAERLRIANNGEIGIGGANYGTAGQVLTSNGSGSAVSWEDASGGGITTEAATPSNAITQINLTDATDHKITATGICTITSTTAGTEGQSHTIRIVNSGIATVGFSTYFLFPSGVTPILPTADGAVSIISFTVHDSVGAGCTQLLAGASLNFS